MVVMQNGPQKKIPVNLVEALGSTPLTYLVPVQNITSLTGIKGADIPMSYTVNISPPPNDSYVHDLRETVKKKEITDEFNDSNIIFNDAPNFPNENVLDQSESLYNDLQPFAKDVIIGVSPIRHSEFLRTVVQPKQPIQQVSASSQSADTPKSANKHRLPSPVSDQSIDSKKRKPDAGVQDEMKKIQVTKLIDLLIKRIGLTDEEAEYEHSDLWDEWPNSINCLSNSAFAEIHDHLMRIVDSPLIDTVPLEVLTRSQVLALRSIKAANEMDWISVNVPGSENSLQYAFNALQASSLVLVIFNSRREDKILELDSYLVDILSFIYTFVEDYLIRIIETECCDLKLLVPFMNLINKTFSQFRVYMIHHQVNDTIITKIEYLTILIIFSQWDKSLLFFKMESSALLISIFQYKRPQRFFIIDEVLNNVNSLPTHRVSSRQIVTHRNTSIQLFTHILVNFVESINVLNRRLEIRLPVSFPDPSSSEFEDLTNQLSNLSKDFSETGSEIEDTITAICSGLISKLLKNLTPTFKLQFQLFITDLLNIVTYPEFQGAEAILRNITFSLLSVSENQPAVVESYLLEIIGMIGSKMLEIRGMDEINIPRDSLTKSKANVYQFLLTLKKFDSFKNSANFFITGWVVSTLNNSEAESQEKLETTKLYYRIMRVILNNSFSKGFTKFEGTEESLKEQVTIDYENVLKDSGFIGLYDSFLNHLLKHVDHPKIKTRTRSLKNLALLINKDPTLLKIPQVKQSISNKIHDSSPLVRLAVLDIFDEYLLRKPEEFEDFYKSIILTNDKSTAVRLKSLKIADKIYQFTSDNTIKINLIDKIFRRLEDDEESVLELSQNILLRLLFLPPNQDEQDNLKLKNQINQTIEVTITFINKSEKNWILFENFLFDMVLRKTSHNSSFHEKLVENVGLITNECFSFVIENMDTDVDVSKRLGLLSILAKNNHKLITQDQLLSLQAYFTNDNCGNDISLYSLMILRQTVSNATALRSQFLEDCEASLLKRLTKLNSRELSQAVPSLSSISALKKDNSKLANAAASCLSLISPYLLKASKGELTTFDPKCARLIFLIGNFAKDCNFEKDRGIFVNKKLSLKKKESVLSFMVKNLVIFTKPHVDDKLRKIAIKNLIAVCSTHPNLFLSEQILKIFDKEFESTQLEFQEVITEGLLEFLERQEKISGKTTVEDKQANGKTGLDVDVFHGNAKTFENDGICASLVQRYIKPVLELCLLEDVGISYTVVKYLRFIVLKGFCNPRLCITTVIALQASTNQYIRGVGLQLFKELFERYESLIDSSYIQGFKEAASFRAKVGSNILEENDLFLSKFYSVIEDSKSSKKKFLSQLTKSFVFDVDSITLEECVSFHNYFLFISINLAQCEFVYYDDVITLIDSLQSISSDQAMALSKLISQNHQVLNNLVNSKPDEFLKIGYLCAILISFERIITCLRQSYKIFENNEKPNELKSQKTKIQKQPVKLIKFDPNIDQIDTLVANFHSIR